MLFHPPAPTGSEVAFENAVKVGDQVNIFLFTSTLPKVRCLTIRNTGLSSAFTFSPHCTLLWNTTCSYDYSLHMEGQVSTSFQSITKQKRLRPTFVAYLHAVAVPVKEGSQESVYSYYVSKFSRWIPPPRKATSLLQSFNFTQDSNSTSSPAPPEVNQTLLFALPRKVSIGVVVDERRYASASLPPDHQHFLQRTQVSSSASPIPASSQSKDAWQEHPTSTKPIGTSKYVPIIFHQNFWLTSDQYAPMSSSSMLSDAGWKQEKGVNRNTSLQEEGHNVTIQIDVSALSLGFCRLYWQLEVAIAQMKQFGFTEKDIDEIRLIFQRNHPQVLLLIFVISAIHLLVDFLAFKNDISHWKVILSLYLFFSFSSFSFSFFSLSCSRSLFLFLFLSLCLSLSLLSLSLSPSLLSGLYLLSLLSLPLHVGLNICY